MVAGGAFAGRGRGLCSRFWCRGFSAVLGNSSAAGVATPAGAAGAGVAVVEETGVLGDAVSFARLRHPSEKSAIRPMTNIHCIFMSDSLVGETCFKERTIANGTWLALDRR